MKKLVARWSLLLAMAGTCCTAVVAQDTARPIKLVVPYAAGGTTDHVARLLQKSLAEILDQTVVVENKPGAAGTLGTEYVARSAPDGNTIVFGNPGPNAIVPAVRKTGYDPLSDLRPLTTVAVMPLVLLAPSDRGPDSLKDFLQRARKEKGTMNFGSSGIGSFAHLTGHEFSRLASLDMVHVPYQGGAPVMTAIMQGDVQVTFATGLESAPLVQAGKLKILAVASPKREVTLPDVPAIAEEIAGFESVIWFGVFAPKGTSDAVAERLRAAVLKAVERPDFKKYLADRHAQAKGSTPQELMDLVKRDMARWGDAVRRARIPM